MNSFIHESREFTKKQEEEIFESIEAVYFIVDQFNHANYQINKLCDDGFNLESILIHKSDLKQKLSVVVKKVAFQIQEHSKDFTKEMDSIYIIKDEVAALLEVISEIRQNLSGSQSQTSLAIRIIVLDTKKKLLIKFRSALVKIKQIYEYTFTLADLITHFEFIEAFKLFHSIIEVIKTAKGFAIMSELEEKFKKQIDNIESRIDDRFASLTIMYEEAKLIQCLDSYQVLDNLSNAPDKLLSYFKAAIESTTTNKLLSILKNTSDQDYQQFTYEDLCSKITSDLLVEALIEICNSIVHSSISYHAIMSFCKEALDSDSPYKEFCQSLHQEMKQFSYIFFKIGSHKLNILLACNDMTYIKFDTFLEIVEHVNTFKDFGKNFFGNNCAELTFTLEKQIYVYFKRYHKERLEELKLFLEHESFAPVPVAFQFTIFDLQEFQFLKDTKYSFNYAKVENDQIGEQLNYQLIPNAFVNPFVYKEKDFRQFSNLGEESLIIMRSPDVDDDLKLNAPVFCNTTLSLMKLLGKYIKASLLFPCIAETVVVSIIQLFYHHLISIYELFVADEHPNNIHFAKQFNINKDDFELMSQSIEKVKRIMNNLDTMDSPASSTNNSPAKKINTLDSVYVINEHHKSNSDNLFLIQERIVAIESIMFMAKQLDLIHPVIDSFLLPQNTPSISADLAFFYDILIPYLSKMREKGYSILICKFIDFDELLLRIANTKWDIKELVTDHSNYIDYLLSGYERFSNILNQVSLAMRVPIYTKQQIWSSLLSISFRILVQGYSECSRKCSNEGRALMQLDFQQLVFKLESESSDWNTYVVKPLKSKAYVENFIKAYYLTETSLEQWISQHKEYSTTQISHLFTTASHISKKAKARILTKLA
uniref:DUF2451 domain-containing protein n=1 Tax=Rhabditophanes sp. KR3021 TaxID=114890 RepID=A0AC35TM65_9BILA